MSPFRTSHLCIAMELPFVLRNLTFLAASVYGLPQMSGIVSPQLSVTGQSQTLSSQSAPSSTHTATLPQYPVNTSSGSVQPTSSAITSSGSSLSFSIQSTVLSSSSSPAATATSGCGAVSVYYGQTAADWDAIDMDSWLNDWWTNYSSAIKSNSYGFAGAFGNWAIGNPDFNCQTDGSTSDCDFNPCDVVTLNNNPDIQQAYYVMESLNQFHTYFTGLGQAFTTSAIAAALAKDEWAETFYIDKDDKAATILKELLNLLGTIIGLVGAFAGLGPTAAGVVAGGASALFSGSYGAASPLIGTHQDDTFSTSAQLGSELSTIVVGAMEGFVSANNQLMQGQNYDNTGDIRSYFNGGMFVDFGGVDINGVTNAINAFLIGNAVNELYRVQKIFIMGGGACGDGQGIGSGPQNYSVCRNGQAWYLYYWQEDNVISVTSHQWGWVTMPPGADSLGSCDYAGITIEDIINSSLDAYNVAGYNYNNITAYNRVQSALQNQWRNPGAQGPSWEGTFTISVCDVSSAINANYQDKDYILQPYNSDNSRPVWCGPICNGDLGQTQAFIQAANMEGFQSPKHLCDEDPGY